MSSPAPYYRDLDPEPKGLTLDKIGARSGKRQAILQVAPKTGPPEDADEFYYWRYKDLLERGIVSSRPDLFEKQKKYGFPRPIHFAEGRMPAAHYKVSAVKSWLREREAATATRPPVPRVIPAPLPQADAPKRPRGRPRKVEPGQHLEAAE